MIPREQMHLLQEMVKYYPVVSLTGPRQSGKSTLVRAAFPNYEYVNLENPQIRTEAEEDPVGFIHNRPNQLIIDEAQHVPELFSMIQTVVDEHDHPGQYILSGSQNFLMNKHISQTLAGRIGLLKLLPLSYQEVCEAPGAARRTNLNDFMLSGGYPRIYKNLESGIKQIPLDIFYSNYLSTYVERDVAGFLDVRNILGFRKFVRLCALRTGSLMNYSALARDADVDARTAKAWLSILESSYLIFVVEPYFTNATKRVVKTPKVYFYDTGLLCHLLGISSVAELMTSPYLGMVFENLIMSERLKFHLNAGKTPQLYFYRDTNQVEVDLFDYTNPHTPLLIEIKSGQTYRESWIKSLNNVGGLLHVDAKNRCVVSGIKNSFTAKGTKIYDASDWLLSQS